MFAPLQSYSGRINQGFQVAFLLSTWQSYQDIDTFPNISISLFYNVPNAFKEVFALPFFWCVCYCLCDLFNLANNAEFSKFKNQLLLLN